MDQLLRKSACPLQELRANTKIEYHHLHGLVTLLLKFLDLGAADLQVRQTQRAVGLAANSYWPSVRKRVQKCDISHKHYVSCCKL